LDLIKRLPNAKKPEQSALVAFINPTLDAISKIDNLRYHGKELKKWGDHYKACYELVESLRWVLMVPPGGSPLGHCDQQTQAVDFNLNRVQKDAKDDKTKAFVQALKKAGKTQTEFVKENFKTGLNWNAKGGDLASAASAQTSAPAKAAEEKKRSTQDRGKTKN
jgi:adenylyl cyclase-associated protein